jgi:anhydro-N-acetylmuramic acid kinase
LGAHERLQEIREKETKRIIGLISGTSADGVSTVAAEIGGSGTGTEIEILGYETYPYPPGLKRDIFRLFSPETSTVDLVCRMNFVLGETFAKAALHLMEDHDISAGEVDLIGSHGQTVQHLPEPRDIHGFRVRSTLQIGEPAVIAERTGISTVADFRKADVAAGGEGAPLTPYLDFVLHRHPDRSRVLQNMGGIANLTHLPAGATVDEVVAFDTGPGNMVIDALVREETRGSRGLDEDGRIAEGGEIDHALLEELLEHPYFSREPPKTTGREVFGEAYASQLLEEAEAKGLSFGDTVATATALTVESIARAYEEMLPWCDVDEIFLSGGGARNRFLVESLASRLAPTPIGMSGDLGLPGDSKEAVLMAVLANQHLMGNPANIPRATGARRAVVLGALYPAP